MAQFQRQIPQNSNLVSTKAPMPSASFQIIDSSQKVPNKNLQQGLIRLKDPHNIFMIDSSLFSEAQIKPHVRSKMLGWLINEAACRKLMRTTYCLSITYLDCFLMKSGKLDIKDFQELGISCLILATKFNESTKRIGFCRRTFSADKIFKFQLEILKKNNFFINPNLYTELMQEILQAWQQFIKHYPSSYGNQGFLLLPSLNCKTEIQAIIQGQGTRNIYELLDICYACPQIMNATPESIVTNVFVYFLTKVEFEGVQTSLKEYLNIFWDQIQGEEKYSLISHLQYTEDSSLQVLIQKIDQIIVHFSQHYQSRVNQLKKIYQEHSDREFFMNVSIYQHTTAYMSKAMRAAADVKMK